MKTVNDIRSGFLDFFKGKGHTAVSSSSLVPTNDPTLLFTNSGMAQFKNVFTGQENRPYTRATTAQKCVRAGGKHNDLDNIGYTARHHTFFEMMGNFSFGDYFKEDAISFAWELVTKVFEMPKNKLLVTVHSSDEEAAGLWRKIAGFSDDKIIRIPTDDNFWQMGDTGPCGPCSEIFIDQGDKLQGGPPGSPEQDGDRFLEFWNIVFMQFEQFNDGRPRIPLPKPCIDTGMGLERMTAVVQGKLSNYDVEPIRSIIEQTGALVGVNPDGSQAPSFRVIADHLRAVAFLIADGVMPSSDGRGYVLRRIMRRAMRHAHLLGAKEPLMYKLVPTLSSLMGSVYPELIRAEALITETLKLEETRFKRTLETGLRLLDEETATLKAGQKFPGVAAFKLYDTFGFPVDLTQDALRAKDIAVDMDAFNTAMEKQKQQARAAWTGSGDAGTEKLWFEVLDKTGPTEFLGYSTESAEGKILALVKDGKAVDAAQKDDEIRLVTNQTPFYAESGGQAGDTGILYTTGGATIQITDTKKILGKLFVHVGKITQGDVKLGDDVDLRVDHARRTSIRANHSATHLLHEALRQTLGAHVAQKGSLQDAERTRFDVSHNAALTDEQIATVEKQVNDEIRANSEIVTRILPLEDAMQSGARALFGEKYDDEVRVVSMGTQKSGANHPYSVELCGGTHASRTGDIGLFKIVAESAVSSGVRRVEALTGINALNWFAEQEARVQDIAGILKSSPAEVVERVRALADDRKKLEIEVSNLRRQLATGGSGKNEAKEFKNIGNFKFTDRVFDGVPAKDLKPIADDMKKKLGSGVAVLIAREEGKASIIVVVTDDLTSRFSAVDLVKRGVEILGGQGGGGRPDMAQGGGPNAGAANDAVSAIEQALSA